MINFEVNISTILQQPNQVTAAKRKPKTNFVEVRTFWHLFRSFDRMWILLILAFQAMVIVAWSPSGSPAAFFDEDVFKSVLSIFITSALLNLLQATLDIILSWKAWGSLKYTQILRYLLKFAVAAAWAVVLPIGYSNSVQNTTGLVKFSTDWAGDWRNQSFYNYAIAIYMIPNILAALLFMLPPLRRSMEHSKLCTTILYLCKLAFSYYVEILPLIGPTKLIMGLRVGYYEWHELFSNVNHNLAVVISIWAPIVLVYFMDTQIWYAIFSTIIGGIHGAFSHLGEIRTLGMLRSRFESVPSAFSKHLVPSSKDETKGRHSTQPYQRKDIAKFSEMWNEFINCMRAEDLISNRERGLLLVPYFSSETVVQWPPFLLASKIPIALDMAKDFKGRDADLFKKIKNDTYMHSAVTECYETFRDLLSYLLDDVEDKLVVKKIFQIVDDRIEQNKFMTEFRMSELPQLNSKLGKLLTLLKTDLEDVETYKAQTVNIIQDILEIITQDVMVNGDGILHRHDDTQNDKNKQKFEKLNLGFKNDKSWMEKVFRLHLLLTVKESAINVPMNLEARRRITFFTNSLFMIMPSAPEVRNMLSFRSVRLNLFFFILPVNWLVNWSFLA
ncbi:hypothetical protein HHK36_005008 [Tetracentron sinense]|uniref:Callose synthase helical domain-containing protein n=1 Tax=Tetracentron sinense TaxID=13715 RepID=A0A834ZPM0_TETSI|nr:hypothetical protein HHK36_005008 [Tetracentron sinense]